jgi:hypothetical protein
MSDFRLVQKKIERSISQYIAFVFWVDTYALVDTITFFIHDMEIGLHLGYWPTNPDQLIISTRQIVEDRKDQSKHERTSLWISQQFILWILLCSWIWQMLLSLMALTCKIPRESIRVFSTIIYENEFQNPQILMDTLEIT